MSGYGGNNTASARQYGIRFLLEQLGVDALNPPVNTIFRLGAGYNSTLNELLVFLNGALQDVNPPDYVETDARTLTMNAGLLPASRLMGIDIVRDAGQGGLIVVDRPPALVAPLTYQTSQNFTDASELWVYMNGQWLINGVQYNAVLPNQFVMAVPIPPGAVFVAVVVSRGTQGLHFRETTVGFGAFPAVVPTVNVLNKNEDEFLVVINGQLQAENLDYQIQYNQVVVTRVIPGVNDIEIIGVRSSHPSHWRA